MEIKQQEPHTRSFIQTYIFSTDHKIIGLQYFFTGMLFFLIGGILSMAIRFQLAFPWKPLPLIGKPLDAQSYLQMVTMHGTIMLIFFIILVLVSAFGNYLVPLQIGAKDMAFPTLNMLSFWTAAVPSAALFIAGFFVHGGPASSGWTMYPPVSAGAAFSTSHTGHILWVLSIIFAGTSTILTGINFVVTIVKLRAPGMDYFKMPLTTWAYFLLSIIIIIGTPVLASGLIMLLLDQLGVTVFFLPSLTRETGSRPLLFQHVFWFYSHPVVYLMILPAWGFVADIFSVFARKPAFGYKITVYSMLAVVAIGFVVWGHHMFVSGMNPLLSTPFSILTAFVGVPTGMIMVNIFLTLYKGSIRPTASLLSAVAVLVIFVTGGLTGLFNALTALNIYVHDTYWVVGHFHFTVGGASMFAVFAGIYYWFPKMFGRKMNDTLGKLHVALSFFPFFFLFLGMHLLGLSGHVRRLPDDSGYQFMRAAHPIQVKLTYLGFALFAAQSLFIFNFFHSLFFGEKAGDNPWDAATLEWATTSPPPHENFLKEFVVTNGPYEYGVNGKDEETKDYLPQWT